MACDCNSMLPSVHVSLFCSSLLLGMLPMHSCKPKHPYITHHMHHASCCMWGNSAQLTLWAKASDSGAHDTGSARQSKSRTPTPSPALTAEVKRKLDAAAARVKGKGAKSVNTSNAPASTPPTAKAGAKKRSRSPAPSVGNAVRCCLRPSRACMCLLRLHLLEDHLRSYSQHVVDCGQLCRHRDRLYEHHHTACIVAVCMAKQ